MPLDIIREDVDRQELTPREVLALADDVRVRVELHHYAAHVPRVHVLLVEVQLPARPEVLGTIEEPREKRDVGGSRGMHHAVHAPVVNQVGSSFTFDRQACPIHMPPMS